MPHNHILLDWDGVVRADWYDYRDEPRDDEQYARLHVYPVTAGENTALMLIDPDVIAAIHRWANRDDTTVYWISANGYFTYELLAPAAGLPELGWAPHASERPGQDGYPGSGFRSAGWWKAQAVRELIAATKHDGDRVLWVDDSINSDLHHHMRNVGAKRLSWVIPETRVGLLPEEVARIDSWLDGAGPFRYNRRDHDRALLQFDYSLEELREAADTAHARIATATDEATRAAAYETARRALKLRKEVAEDAKSLRRLADGKF